MRYFDEYIICTARRTFYLVYIIERQSWSRSISRQILLITQISLLALFASYEEVQCRTNGTGDIRLTISVYSKRKLGARRDKVDSRLKFMAYQALTDHLNCAEGEKLSSSCIPEYATENCETNGEAISTTDGDFVIGDNVDEYQRSNGR